MADVVLYPVPADGVNNDIWLRDPNTIAINGTFAATEAQDTSSFAGVLVYAGAVLATDGQDTASFSGNLVYSGSLLASEAQDTAVFAGAVSATSVNGVLAATDAQDGVSFAGNARSNNLHGRRLRGKRVIFPDEIDPVAEIIAPTAPRPVPLPSLETARNAVAGIKCAIAEIEQARETAKKATAIAKLARDHDAAQERLAHAIERERYVIRRMHDEDELMLIAA